MPLPATADTVTAFPGATGPDTVDAADPELTALRTFAAAHGGHGWRPWRPVALPDGTTVLVGGEEPGARRTPPPAVVDSLLAVHVPVLLDLARWVPVLGGVETTAEARGEGVWEIEARVRNDGPVPYPTAQGRLCRVWPAREDSNL